jgi:hypothetical protein
MILADQVDWDIILLSLLRQHFEVFYWQDKRGLMVGLNELGITLGFVMAFFFGYILHGVKDSW